MGDDEATPHFDSSQEEINYWRSQARDLQDVLRETESNLQDFMESSKDLEAEMEREIASSTKRLNEMAVKNEALRGDCDEWKTKYQKALAEHNATLAQMHNELDQLRTSHNAYKTKLRDMELDNDELESAERMVASSLADMESRYNKAIERTALLEEELVDKSKLEEENQRLKDELRDLNEELSVMREAAARTPAVSRTETPASEATQNHERSSTDELSLADLVINRPTSRATREGMISHAPSPPPVRSSAKAPYTPKFSHSRRGSRDVRDLINRAAVNGQDDSASSLGMSRAYSNRQLRENLGSSINSPRAPRAVQTSNRAGTNTGASLNMMHDMMARMRTLEHRIASARNLAKIAPVESDKSAIPRPMLRSSLGPSSGGSPIAARASGRITPLGGRPSFDGSATVSGIPVPANGLTKSTNRRPHSRLSNVSDRATPPLPARSVTPNHMYAPTSSLARATSPFDLELSDLQRTVTKRRGSVTRPRGSTTSSGSTAPPLTKVGELRAAGSRPASGSAAGGPPSAWRVGTGRARSSSSAGSDDR